MLFKGVNISDLEGWMTKLNSNPSMFGHPTSRRWFRVSFLNDDPNTQKLILSYSTNKHSKEPRGWLYIEDIHSIKCTDEWIEMYSLTRTLRIQGESKMEHRLWADSLCTLFNLHHHTTETTAHESPRKVHDKPKARDQEKGKVKDRHIEGERMRPKDPERDHRHRSSSPKSPRQQQPRLDSSPAHEDSKEIKSSSSPPTAFGTNKPFDPRVPQKSPHSGEEPGTKVKAIRQNQNQDHGTLDFSSEEDDDDDADPEREGKRDSKSSSRRKSPVSTRHEEKHLLAPNASDDGVNNTMEPPMMAISNLQLDAKEKQPDVKEREDEDRETTGRTQQLHPKAIQPDNNFAHEDWDRDDHLVAESKKPVRAGVAEDSNWVTADWDT